METNLSIYGLDVRHLTWNRFYKIYVTRDCLCGAYIAGEIYDEESARRILQQLAFFLKRRIRRILEQREIREAEYDRLEVTSAEFLESDHRNFCIERNQVVRVTVDRARSRWVPRNVGTLTVELGDGSSRRFILMPDQDAEAITELLRAFFPNSSAVGTATPLPTKIELRRRRLVGYTIHAVLFTCFGIFFLAVGIRFVQLRHHIIIGIVNLLAAFYLIRLARKNRREACEGSE